VTSAAGAFAYEYSPGVSGGAAYSSRLIKRLLLPNSSAITNDFDPVARLLGTYLKYSSGAALDSYTYIYNPASQRTNLTRADASTVAYKYDSIGQLKVADSSVSSEDRGYLYDTGWNLSKRTNNGVVGTFTVDTKNQVTAA